MTVHPTTSATEEGGGGRKESGDVSTVDFIPSYMLGFEVPSDIVPPVPSTMPQFGGKEEASSGEVGGGTEAGIGGELPEDLIEDLVEEDLYREEGLRIRGGSRVEIPSGVEEPPVTPEEIEEKKRKAMEWYGELVSKKAETEFKLKPLEENIKREKERLEGLGKEYERLYNKAMSLRKKIMSIVDEYERLKDMYENGEITREEYEARLRQLNAKYGRKYEKYVREYRRIINRMREIRGEYEDVAGSLQRHVSEYEAIASSFNKEVEEFNNFINNLNNEINEYNRWLEEKYRESTQDRTISGLLASIGASIDAWIGETFGSEAKWGLTFALPLATWWNLPRVLAGYEPKPVSTYINIPAGFIRSFESWGTIFGYNVPLDLGTIFVEHPGMAPGIALGEYVQGELLAELLNPIIPMVEKGVRKAKEVGGKIAKKVFPSTYQYYVETGELPGIGSYFVGRRSVFSFVKEKVGEITDKLLRETKYYGEFPSEVRMKGRVLSGGGDILVEAEGRIYTYWDDIAEDVYKQFLKDNEGVIKLGGEIDDIVKGEVKLWRVSRLPTEEFASAQKIYSPLELQLAYDKYFSGKCLAVGEVWMGEDFWKSFYRYVREGGKGIYTGVGKVGGTPVDALRFLEYVDDAVKDVRYVIKFEKGVLPGYSFEFKTMIAGLGAEEGVKTTFKTAFKPKWALAQLDEYAQMLTGGLPVSKYAELGKEVTFPLPVSAKPISVKAAKELTLIPVVALPSISGVEVGEAKEALSLQIPPIQVEISAEIPEISFRDVISSIPKLELELKKRKKKVRRPVPAVRGVSAEEYAFFPTPKVSLTSLQKTELETNVFAEIDEVVGEVEAQVEELISVGDLGDFEPPPSFKLPPPPFKLRRGGAVFSFSLLKKWDKWLSKWLTPEKIIRSEARRLKKASRRKKRKKRGK